MATTYESEDVSQQVLWDLFDSGVLSTDGDTLALGFDSIWNNGFVPLQSPNVKFVYLHSLLDQLKSAGVITALDINSNFCGAGLPAICDPPFNDRFSFLLPEPFPQFVIRPNQTILCGVSDVCSVNAGTGQKSLAVASDFYRIEIVSAGTLTIDLTVVFPLRDNLDLAIFENEQGGALVFSVGPTGAEQMSISLLPGTYMIQVRGTSTSSV